MTTIPEPTEEQIDKMIREMRDLGIPVTREMAIQAYYDVAKEEAARDRR